MACGMQCVEAMDGVIAGFSVEGIVFKMVQRWCPIDGVRWIAECSKCYVCSSCKCYVCSSCKVE
jgi:hypothetical protein